MPIIKYPNSLVLVYPVNKCGCVLCVTAIG